ncbi:hypothetical protein J437_LFUL000753 [Ladona fulva]|uniref:Uncharacterized protein n=1 Tax=Ladona fulva TaxID=123851 RepID=A0A8K0KS97_LADFU|nr:hypothetical protein J437_LFUL000753 [Ladona fulva]
MLMLSIKRYRHKVTAIKETVAIIRKKNKKAVIWYIFKYLGSCINDKVDPDEVRARIGIARIVSMKFRPILSDRSQVKRSELDFQMLCKVHSVIWG